LCDLIQEQRSLVGQLQPSGLLVRGAIGCSLLISEQFALGIDAMRTIADRKRELLIKSAKNHNEVFIQVQDSGRGLDPQQAGRIFQPFFTTKPEGIGMGLSISRSIVESHGGRLWAESGSRGARFQFTLPTK
jgi:signal transduction histidine kinase